MIHAVIFDMYETLITLFESPVYFGKQIAEDLGVDEKAFRGRWNVMNAERSTGKISLEQILELIVRENDCYDEDVLKKVIEKRRAVKRESFHHIHPEIIPMLQELKDQGIKIGLISNCFSEEVTMIRESVLFPFFDGAFLSYEQGIQKPDKEIFRRCMEALNVKANECIYVGDGGSHELETAEELGMRALQATWYIKEGSLQPTQCKEGFVHLKKPSDVLVEINNE